ncbi:uncharacterized protein LOC142796208 [Rhipicephalus microplus]|uniref:uncharacterized protein LOC142796208 n=1 Tax=Rhipicephalus microplus TaxID=6941 RepID=UPI003F6ABE94
MLPRRQNHCFAPDCRTGYVHVKGSKKPSLFGAPKDAALRKQWERNLHRADKALDDTSAMCELHFEPKCVLRDYVHIIEGKEVRTPRGKPCLREDAVRTILPNLASYLTKKTPQERPTRKRKRSGSVEGDKVRSRTIGATVDGCAVNSTETPATCAQLVEARPDDILGDLHSDAESSNDKQASTDLFVSLRLPSLFWSKHQFPDNDGVVYCTTVLTAKSEVQLEKVVMFVPSSSDVYYKVYARGTLLKEVLVRSEAEAETILEETNSVMLCGGAISQEDYEDEWFTQKLKGQVVSRHGSYFSRSCMTKVAKKGAQCVSCKYLRRAMLMRRSRVQSQHVKSRSSHKRKLRTVTQKNRRLVRRLSCVKEDLAKMQEKNAAIKTETLKKHITYLPQRQRDAVSQCFATAKVKNAGKGIQKIGYWNV